MARQKRNSRHTATLKHVASEPETLSVEEWDAKLAECIEMSKRARSEARIMLLQMEETWHRIRQQLLEKPNH